MQTKKTMIRQKKVNHALGIAMVEGKRPSPAALNLSARYVAGEITAAQAKQLYLKSAGLVP